MSQRLAQAWYEGRWWLWLLAPFTVLYVLIAFVRRGLYRVGVLKTVRFRVPVIVVGNITVGGTGKTPLTLALIEFLRVQGYRPGVVSRGYGGHADYPLSVQSVTSASLCGDEPLALHQRSGVPVIVDPKRVRALKYLLANTSCDVVISDDGLQHYALHRDIEIAVIDGARGVGNGYRLPMGPLREPVARLKSVSQVVVNGEGFSWHGAISMQLAPMPWRPLVSASDKFFDVTQAPKAGEKIHAVAGIGNPERFFRQLRMDGYDVLPHVFADHHAYIPEDFAFADDLPIVMTEKDAVKCREFAQKKWWFVPVRADLPDNFFQSILTSLKAFKAS